MDSAQAVSLEFIMLNEYEQWNLPYRTFGDSFLDMDAGHLRRLLADEILQIQFKSETELYRLIVDYFSRPGCYLYYVHDHVLFESGTTLRRLGVKYQPKLEFQLEILCTMGLCKREDVEFSFSIKSQNRPIGITYFRLTELGIEFLGSCARDAVKKLESRQEADYKVIHSGFATRHKSRSKFMKAAK